MKEFQSIERSIKNPITAITSVKNFKERKGIFAFLYRNCDFSFLEKFSLPISVMEIYSTSSKELIFFLKERDFSNRIFSKRKRRSKKKCKLSAIMTGLPNG